MNNGRRNLSPMLALAMMATMSSNPRRWDLPLPPMADAPREKTAYDLARIAAAEAKRARKAARRFTQ